MQQTEKYFRHISGSAGKVHVSAAGSDFPFFLSVAFAALCHLIPDIQRVAAARQMFASATGSRSVCRVSECDS